MKKIKFRLYKWFCACKEGFVRRKEKFQAKIRKGMLSDNSGVGIIEVILILVILIAVVLLFKTQITDIIEKAFSSITNDSNGIIK